MKAALTFQHIEQYSDVLDGLIDAAEAQTNGLVRKPRWEIEDFVGTLIEVCIALNYQFSGQALPDRNDLVEARRKAELLRARAKRLSSKSTAAAGDAAGGRRLPTRGFASRSRPR